MYSLEAEVREQRFYAQFIKALLVIALATISVSGYASDWAQTDKLVGNNTLPGSWAGWGSKGVDISGDLIVVGAAQPNNVGPGEAYVYQKSPSGWMEIAELAADDGENNDLFGQAVAIDGTTAVVTASNENSLGSSAGAAYVFEYNNSSWQQVAKLTASDGAARDSFGSDVAIFGDTIVVGADHDQDQGHFTGAAYVFEHDGSGWNETAKLTASDQAEFDGFGYSVATNGNTVLVGAVDEGIDGSVYVFDKSGASWLETDKLTPAASLGGSSAFGSSLDMESSRAVIGAFRSNENGSSSGSAFVFDKAGATWLETTKLTALDAEAGDSFGISAGLDGDTIVVGAYLEDEVNFKAGAAYLFEFEGTIWNQTDKLTIPTGGASDLFGYSVAIDSGNVVATSLGDDQGGSNAGAAFVFTQVPEPGSLALFCSGHHVFSS